LASLLGGRFGRMCGQLDGSRRLFLVCGVTWHQPTNIIVLGSKRFPELGPCWTTPVFEVLQFVRYVFCINRWLIGTCLTRMAELRL
jgi:hypothetical protein